ncbi:hypothetical protein C8J56DRAFT_235455 [Mycena floridula]|nr:hypothetical protein C8J56DRAFT_235455 [Mycena floridula]
MSFQPWPVFRNARIFIFMLCCIISLGCTIVYTVLIVRGWSEYSLANRVLMLSLAIVHGIGAIMLFLMLVLSFRVWLDVARIFTYIFFQLGVEIAFTLLGRGVPCDNLGSQADCRIISLSVSLGSGSLSALLIIYAVMLLFISRIPQPAPNETPNLVISEPFSSKELLEKRPSLMSTYSQDSFAALFVPSKEEDHKVLLSDQYGIYRANTPESVDMSVEHQPRESFTELPYYYSEPMTPLSAIPPHLRARQPLGLMRGPMIPRRSPSVSSYSSYSSEGNEPERPLMHHPRPQMMIPPLNGRNQFPNRSPSVASSHSASSDSPMQPQLMLYPRPPAFLPVPNMLRPGNGPSVPRYPASAMRYGGNNTPTGRYVGGRVHPPTLPNGYN